MAAGPGNPAPKQQALKYSGDGCILKEPFLFKQMLQQKVICENLSSQLWEHSLMQSSWLPVLEDKFKLVLSKVPDPLNLPHWVKGLWQPGLGPCALSEQTGTFLLYLLS